MRGTYPLTLPYEIQGYGVYISTYCVNLIRYLRCSATAIQRQGTHGLSLPRHARVAQVAKGSRGVWQRNRPEVIPPMARVRGTYVLECKISEMIL